MMGFGSDNEAPVREEIMQAIFEANAGAAASYGEDPASGALAARFAEVFETRVTVHPALTGTAANAISLAQLVPPYGAAICHQHAHINIHECGAPEFFSGGKLLTLAGENGKVAAIDLERSLRQFIEGGYHSNKVTALSLTQATEYGTVYSLAELGELSAVAHAHGLKVHMDGARLANALAFLDCSPAEATWRAGVDILSFGSSKNGTLNAEAIVAFEPGCATELQRSLKQAGQLASKMRYVSTQLLAYLEEGRWLRWAAQANQLARELAAGLAEVPQVEVKLPVQANMLIVELPDALESYLLGRGVTLYPWHDMPDYRRLVLSNLNSTKDVGDFLQLISNWATQNY